MITCQIIFITCIIIMFQNKYFRTLSQYEIIFLWLSFTYASHHCGFDATIETHTTTLFSFQWETTIEDVYLECTTFDTWLLFPLHLMRPRVVICNMRWIMLILLLLFDNFSNFFEIFEITFLELFQGSQTFQDSYTPTCLLRRHI